MWSDRQLKGAMSSSLDMASHRPWTPPDTDSEHSVSRTADAGGGDKDSDMDAQRILRPPFSTDASMASLADTSHEPKSTRRSTFASLVDSGYVGEAHDMLPQDVQLDEPHTPVNQTRSSDPLALNIPRYPYTPDSARIPKFSIPPLLPSPSKKAPSLYPSASMPWDNKVSSPVQNALSSCMMHLENLIQTRQPNEEQMEYIVARFEEMAQFLSAPEAQSRQSDDHLFSELSEIPSGLGIISGVLTDNSDRIEHGQVDTALQYIKEVERYITHVSRHTEDLKVRFDETKRLIYIQTEVIADLRRILKTQQVEMEKMTEELDVELSAVDEHEQRMKEDEQLEQRPPAKETKCEPPVSFWTAIGEALDAAGELWLEY